MTIADQLAVALQNARLFDQTARQARRESQVVEITGKIRAAGDMDGMLRTAVSELRRALGVGKAAVRLERPAVTQPAPEGTLPEPGPAESLDTNGGHSAPANGQRNQGQAGNGSNGSQRNGNGSHPNGGPNGNGHGPASGAEG